MDGYYRISSEVLDSWDLIHFPVKDSHRDLYREKTSVDDINPYPSAYFLRGVRKKLSRRKDYLKNKQKVESSTSLVLNKTTKKQIFKEHSVLNFTDILQSQGPVYGDFGDKYSAIDNKPLIKVTVIPKTTGTFSGKSRRIRKENTRKTLKPIANPDNSVNTKNLYLVVAGPKNEKVYELNTKSVKFTESKSLQEDDSTDCAKIKGLQPIMNKYKKNITHSRKNKPASAGELVESYTRYDYNCLGTERRRGDEVKPPKTMSKNITSTTEQITRRKIKVPEGARARSPSDESTKCRDESPTLNPQQFDVSGHKSRIRITGRLGLNEDDQYVLKCNATLDDEPIATYEDTGYTLMPMTLLPDGEIDRSPVNKSFRTSRNQRDSNIQADVRYYSSSAYGKASQGTQVNLDIYYSQRHYPKANDKIVQCRRTDNVENATYISDDIEADVALKKCASPIVIISVYPQDGSNDKMMSNKVSLAEDLKKQFSSPVEFNQNIKQKIRHRKEESKITRQNIGRSRSPSPPKNQKTDKDAKTRAYASNSKKQLRETSLYKKPKMTSSIVQSAQTKDQMKTVTNKKTEQRPKVTLRCSSQRKRADSPKPRITKGTNTQTMNNEQMITKKALVDEFTNKYTAQMNERKTKGGLAFKRKNVSNVTVNIEGDNEYYNVMLHQGELETDLRVRKCTKGNMVNFLDDTENSSSLENFLFIQPENDPMQKSFSQTLTFDGVDPSTNLTSTSKIKVRDSIEISHRREDRPSNAGKVTQPHLTTYKNDVSNEVETEYLAPIRHFQGDDCSISDPNERDKEIRKLLGIHRGRFQPVYMSQASTVFGQRDPVFLDCLYQSNSVNFCQNQKNTQIYISPWKAALDQQLILDRQIQTLLQIKQLNKKDLIVLKRQQYAKLRKTIGNNSLERRTNDKSRDSLLSIGNIRVKTKKQIIYHYNKESQTEAIELANTKMEEIKHDTGAKFINKTINNAERANLADELSKQVDAILLSTHNIKAKESVQSIHERLDLTERGFLTQCILNTDKHSLSYEKHETTILFNASSQQKAFKEDNADNKYTKRAASSLEIQYARVAFLKQVKFSSSDVAHTSTAHSIKHSISQNLERKDSHSIHTLFKGHRRSLTPNLGTSAYSLCPEDGSDHSDTAFKCFNDPSNYELKPKKPFLRRLISCLVLRTSKASVTKFPVEPVKRDTSLSSSIDSYHINTSLGEIDMGSSIYDTSASFYSNHTIKPVSKMKRGFFSSVREFLGSRMSSRQ